uniref:FACT complex subunit SPT16 C-terminal domain-containing protein n=1 Tax=Timema cristinae TaxID=61476 RepID=A0A7R9GYE2_TIMCR|nr:unnamed protein product [Timema cristinae]
MLSKSWPTDVESEESDEDSEYSEYSEDSVTEGFEDLKYAPYIYDYYANAKCVLIEEELASSEESGKDWSDLEREAAEADKERADYQDEYADSKNTNKRPGGSFNNRSPSKHHKSDKDKNRHSSSKSSSKHRHSSSNHKDNHKDNHKSKSHDKHSDLESRKKSGNLVKFLEFSHVLQTRIHNFYIQYYKSHISSSEYTPQIYFNTFVPFLLKIDM